MKEIKLTQGKVVIVDDEDFELLNKWKWRFDYKGYAIRSVNFSDGTKGSLYMHRLLLGIQKGDRRQSDHIDGNGLNNQKTNLRACSSSENLCNRGIPKNNTSGYKGVKWHKGEQKWAAAIKKNGKYISLGYYNDKKEAAKIYNEAAIEHHGDFAFLNAIKED
ncbi:MAG: AP2 domain-containing protein [Thermodesulfobacteriota bacterium]